MILNWNQPTDKFYSRNINYENIREACTLNRIYTRFTWNICFVHKLFTIKPHQQDKLNNLGTVSLKCVYDTFKKFNENVN